MAARQVTQWERSKLIEPVRFQSPDADVLEHEGAEVIPLREFPMAEMPGMDTTPVPLKPRTVAPASTRGRVKVLKSDDTVLTKAQFLARLSDDQLTCRANAHVWPVPVPNRKRPKGFNAIRQHDGCFQITHTCDRCGETRETVTLPGGVLDTSAKYTYRYPDGWVRFALEDDISRADIRAEYYRRLFEQIA